MPSSSLIVSAVNLSRTFGEGGAAVHALADVSVDFRNRRLHRHHGTVGLRQVDAHAPARRPRPASRRHVCQIIRGEAIITAVMGAVLGGGHLAGVLAAVVPARKASRMDVLDALAHQ